MRLAFSKASRKFLPTIPRGNIRLDRLSERQSDVGTVLGVSQEDLVVGVAEVARLEQDRRRTSAPQHVKRREAVRLGLNYRNGSRERATTANGTIIVYTVKLDTMRVGGIELHNVDAIVHDGDHPTLVLLGMSFLNRVDMRRDGTLLTLTHEQFFDEGARDRHQAGWTETLEKLAALFA